MTNDIRNVRDIDWAKWRGAYGPSGSGPHDVADAIEALSAGPDDEERFAEAIELLSSHVWHQGSIYPVTAQVLPFLFEIMDGIPSDTLGAYDELAGFIPRCACSARIATRAKDPREREGSEDVLTALRSERARLLAWTRTPLRGDAVATMLQVSDLRSLVLTPNAELALEPRDVLLIVLGQLGEGGLVFDTDVLSWTARALEDLHHEVATSAASMLREAAGGDERPRSPPKLAALANALGRNERLDTVADLFFPLRIPNKR